MSKNFRVVMVILLSLITLLSFKGFPYAAYDVKNTTVVQGVGIDYDEKKREYTLTVEVFDVSQSAGADEVSGGNLTKVITVKGGNVSEAMEKLTLEIGKTIIYSQKRLVVISRDALMQGVTGVIDFFVRDYKTRASVLIATTVDSTAAEIIGANEGDVSFPARELQELLESGKINGYTTEVDFATLSELMKDEYTSAYLPVLEVHKSDDDTYAALSGFLVLKDEKPAGVLSLEEGRGLLFATDKIHSGTVNIDNENLGLTSLKIVSGNTRVGVSADKEPHFVVNIECVMDIMEIRAEKDVAFNEKNIDEIEKDAEKYVYNTTAETVKKCLDDLNCDVFGFGRRMWILYPSYFENKDESQKKTFDSNSVDIRVDVRIRRVGQGSI